VNVTPDSSFPTPSPSPSRLTSGSDGSFIEIDVNEDVDAHSAPSSATGSVCFSDEDWEPVQPVENVSVTESESVCHCPSDIDYEYGSDSDQIDNLYGLYAAARNNDPDAWLDKYWARDAFETALADALEEDCWVRSLAMDHQDYGNYLDVGAWIVSGPKGPFQKRSIDTLPLRARFTKNHHRTVGCSGRGSVSVFRWATPSRAGWGRWGGYYIGSAAKQFYCTKDATRGGRPTRMSNRATAIRGSGYGSYQYSRATVEDEGIDITTLKDEELESFSSSSLSPDALLPSQVPHAYADWLPSLRPARPKDAHRMAFARSQHHSNDKKKLSRDATVTVTTNEERNKYKNQVVKDGVSAKHNLVLQRRAERKAENKAKQDVIDAVRANIPTKQSRSCSSTHRPSMSRRVKAYAPTSSSSGKKTIDLNDDGNEEEIVTRDCKLFEHFRMKFYQKYRQRIENAFDYDASSRGSLRVTSIRPCPVTSSATSAFMKLLHGRGSGRGRGVLRPNEEEIRLAFHGTTLDNLSSIMRMGLKSRHPSHRNTPRRFALAFGEGVFTTSNPSKAAMYTKLTCKTILVCAVLTPRSITVDVPPVPSEHSDPYGTGDIHDNAAVINGDYIVARRAQSVVPLFFLDFDVSPTAATLSPTGCGFNWSWMRDPALPRHRPPYVHDPILRKWLRRAHRNGMKRLRQEKHDAMTNWTRLTTASRLEETTTFTLTNRRVPCCYCRCASCVKHENDTLHLLFTC